MRWRGTRIARAWPSWENLPVCYFKRLLKLLEGYKAQGIYNADEMGLQRPAMEEKV
jgi:hypothetical protein